jgi:hypothetical protein
MLSDKMNQELLSLKKIKANQEQMIWTCLCVDETLGATTVWFTPWMRDSITCLGCVVNANWTRGCMMSLARRV